MVLDDVDEVAFLDNYRSGMSLLTPMATHTSVGLVIQDEVGGVDGTQDDEDDSIKHLEDGFQVVDVVYDVPVVVKGLENELDVVKAAEDGFDEVDVAQEKTVAVKRLRDDESDVDVLQDEEAVLGHVHIEEQDVQVEDEHVDKKFRTAHE